MSTRMLRPDPDKTKLPFLRDFVRQEEGGVIIMTLFLIITMLIVGGMSVDFMRYESKRVELQSVSDRAVLAAADLNQSLPAKDVVVDFFETVGLEHTIQGEPVVLDTGNSRTVVVNSEIDMSTIYLRLVGIDQLTAPATSSAIEGVGKVEISLVLDISGSMRYGGSGSRGRFADMQKAAKAFANLVLHPDNGGHVSLNIVPYAGATNPGPVMFDYLNGQRYGSTGSVTGSYSDEDDDDGTSVSSYPNVSSCLEFNNADWNSSGMPGLNRAQVPHFMNWGIAASVMDWGWCPQDRSAIRYGLQSGSEAADFIDGLRMHDGTGTHYAMKYGLAALDPATQPAFDHLNTFTYTGADGTLKPQVPDDFTDRPAAWDDPETRKIIVLMTDGRITEQVRPKDTLHPDNPTKNLLSRPSNERMNITSAATNIASFNKVCDLAKDTVRDVEVFTVAFEVSGSGASQMRDCASDPSMYFATAGSNLTSVFESIARQITDLRLNL